MVPFATETTRAAHETPPLVIIDEPGRDATVPATELLVDHPPSAVGGVEIRGPGHPIELAGVVWAADLVVPLRGRSGIIPVSPCFFVPRHRSRAFELSLFRSTTRPINPQTTSRFREFVKKMTVKGTTPLIVRSGAFPEG
jgi:hypothetical protein